MDEDPDRRYEKYTDLGMELEIEPTDEPRAERPPNHPGGDRVSFQGDVERSQEDQMFSQIMGQVAETFPFVGRTIEHAMVEDQAGWDRKDRRLILHFRGGGHVVIRGYDSIEGK